MNSTCALSNWNNTQISEVSSKPMAFVIGELARGCFEYLYSRWPSFTLPLVSGGSLECKIPSGSYIESCHKPVVNYQRLEHRCRLETRCATIYDGMPHQISVFEFDPEELVLLENTNGTLRQTNIPEKHISAIFRFDESGKIVPVSYDSTKYKQYYSHNPETLEAFQRLATATGGFATLTSSPKELPKVIDALFGHILETTKPCVALDIALILDTTGSMHDDIDEIKQNLFTFLTRMQKEKPEARVALVQYKDDERTSTFLIGKHEFTSDFLKIQEAVTKIRVGGGGDEPEAVLDALLWAKELAWKEGAKHVAILIGDAPPHPKTVHGSYSEEDVIRQLQEKDIKITVYPIVTTNKDTKLTNEAW